jgi:hypothetical protein
MNPAIQAEAKEVCVEYAGAQDWRIPATPGRHDWARFAALKLRLRLAPHAILPGPERSFHDVMDRLASHPAYATEAEAAITEADAQFTAAELAAVQAQIEAISLGDWQLTPAEIATAKVCAGLLPCARGFDHKRERARLELQAGALAVAGYLEDFTKVERLKADVARLQAALETTTAAQRAAADRKRRVAAAKAERASCRKRETEPVASA